MKDEPLWSDDMIYASVDKVSFDVLHEGRIQTVVSGVMAEALIMDMRDANRIALAALAERAAPQAGPAVMPWYVREAIQRMADAWREERGLTTTHAQVQAWLTLQPRDAADAPG